MDCSNITQIYGTSIAISGDRVTGTSDSAKGTFAAFGYDEFDCLTSSGVCEGASQNFSYVYDRYGNRVLQNRTSGTGPSFSAAANKATNQLVGQRPPYAYSANRSRRQCSPQSVLRSHLRQGTAMGTRHPCVSFEAAARPSANPERVAADPDRLRVSSP